jgi:hypothetical protein
MKETIMPETGEIRNTDSPAQWLVFVNPYDPTEYIGVEPCMTCFGRDGDRLMVEVTHVYGSGATMYGVTTPILVFDRIGDAVNAIKSRATDGVCRIEAHSEGEIRLIGRAR